MRRHIYIASASFITSIVFACGERGSDQTLIVGDEPRDAGGPPVVVHEPGPATGEPTPPPAVTHPASDDGKDFSVLIRNAGGASVNSVALPCGGGCIDVEAVVTGGTPPLQLRWEDSSELAIRHFCAQSSATLSVSVTDTAVQASEFGHDPRTRKAELAVQVAECIPDAGVAPVAPVAPMMPNACHPDSGPRCELMGNVLPEDVTVDLIGGVHYFARGARLPAGRYRLAYVDGCNTYGLLIGWSVHGGKGSPGLASCSLVGDDGMAFMNTPGTELYPESGPGEAPSYKECVALNCQLPPLDFDFAGGKLGVMRDGGGELGAIDDSGGDSQGGRNPTFRLIRLDPCPS